MNKLNNLNFENILNFKNKITKNNDIITILNTVSENIKGINKNSFTNVKTKSYINKNISVDKQLISLLNLITDVNKFDITEKITNLDFNETDIDLIIENIHKKFCLEYHFFNIYIHIIKTMIRTDYNNFSNKLLWNSLINKIQTVFESLFESDKNDDDINIDYYSGNLLFIFFLCKERLLSLSVISKIFDIFENNIESTPILINVLFKSLEHIPLHKKYNSTLIKNINILLEKNIPFRLKFKLEQLKDKINLEVVNFDQTKKSKKNQKSQKNIDFEKEVINIIDRYKENLSIKKLEEDISKIKNFRKSYFFKIFVLNILKVELSKEQFKSLNLFIFQKKYKPGNYKNILTQILKIIKKLNEPKIIEKFDIIHSVKI